MTELGKVIQASNIQGGESVRENTDELIGMDGKREKNFPVFQ